MLKYPKIEKIRSGFYRFTGLKFNLKIKRSRNKWYLGAYNNRWLGELYGPFDTLSAAYSAAEIETS